MEILVVEDDPVSQALVRAVLERAGHKTTLAVNGREAWRTWSQAKHRLIVSDWLMPEMDGLEFCRAVRNVRADAYTYFVLLTSRSGRENFLEAMAAGVDDFMTKPIDAEELKARVHVAERILGLRRELRLLEGLLPICSYCKRIRNSNENWMSLEEYVQKHAEVEFSHGVCPTCYSRYLQPQIDDLEK